MSGPDTFSLQTTAIQTVSSTAAQSAINGDSFTDSLRGQFRNVLVYSVAQMAANEIGNMAHPTDIYGNATTPKINMAEQLTLHAGLGCAVGIATGTDCGSGAISGVAGELAAKYAHENGVSRDGSIQVASIIGGGSSAIYSNLVGQSDQEAANNAWEGSRIGRNAAENNAIYIGGTLKVPFWGKDYDIHSGIQTNLLFREDSFGTDGRGTNSLLVPEIGIGMYAYRVPHNETPLITTSYGYRDTLSADYIYTNKGNSGYGYTVGVSTAPVTIIPINISVSIPNKNN